MDLDDLLERKHRPRGERWRDHEDDHHPGRGYARGHGDVARILSRVVAAKRWLIAAALGVLLVVLVTAVWVSVLVLGFIGDHGVKGLVEAILGFGTRLWEGARAGSV